MDLIIGGLSGIISRTITAPLELFKIQGQNAYLPNTTLRDTIKNEVNQEIFKRFYKPFYIPLIALLCCFLIIIPKNNYKYERNRKIVFLIIFLAIIVSEASLRYSTISNFATALYLMIPILSFILIYAIFYKKVRNV